MDYLKIYPERMAKCQEIIDDAMASGNQQEITEAYELIGRLFMASMGYAFEEKDPGFSRRSVEGAEWKDWQGDIDRANAKAIQMREIGKKGGQARAASRSTDVPASVGEQITMDSYIATLNQNEATPAENEATAEEEEATTSDAKESASDATETASDANENSSPNTKTKSNTKSKANAKAYTKTQSLQRGRSFGVEESGGGGGYPLSKSEGNGRILTFPQSFPQSRGDAATAMAATGGEPTTSGKLNTATAASAIDEALRVLCHDFPDVDNAGFRVELRKDLEEYGADDVRRWLLEAVKNNSREKISWPFYKSVRERMIREYVRKPVTPEEARELRAFAEAYRQRKEAAEAANG